MILNKIKVAPSFISLIPSIVLIPVLYNVIKDIHIGGINLVIEFLKAATNPSIERVVLLNSWNGLQITLAIAIVAWGVTIITGTFIGILCSKTFSKVYGIPLFISKFLRIALAIPRSIHELIWGLLLIQILGVNIWIAFLAITIPYSALFARVVRDQIDTLDSKKLIALKQTGSSSSTIFLTCITPKMIPIISIYGGYRLECALRGTTLLGVFGLGGIGTDLQLSIQSLQFREVWTSLWMLGITMILIENILKAFRNRSLVYTKIGIYTISSAALLVVIIIVSLYWLTTSEISALTNISFHPFPIPSITDIAVSFNKLEITKLCYETILLTVLSAGIAIGLPPIILMMWPTQTGGSIVTGIWILLRLIPTPLIGLLLLFCINPSIYVAAVALGLHNMGVMGRVLKENIDNQNNCISEALNSAGLDSKSSWLYGQFNPQSKGYLAYSAFRVDVILRETCVVGIIGGVGLGWQLQESLSSFNWSEVTLITFTFALLTICGELISESVNNHILNSKTEERMFKGFTMA